MIDRCQPVSQTNIDNEFYNELNEEWWNIEGPQYGLHQMNPFRTDYFHRVIQKAGFGSPEHTQIVEVGCGGGIVSEAMAKRGYDIRAVDLSPSSVAAARAHATITQIPNPPEYVVGNAYKLPFEDKCTDVVIMSDVLEHLTDLPLAIKEVSRILKPGGLFIFDTFNRTWWSWLLGIFGAQLFLGIVPSHCHDWVLFVKPRELSKLLAPHGITLHDLSGFGVFMSPLSILRFLLSKQQQKPRLFFFHQTSLSVQYFGYAIKEKNSTLRSGISAQKVVDFGEGWSICEMLALLLGVALLSLLFMQIMY